MADCSSSACLTINFQVIVSIPLIAYQPPECPLPDAQELEKAKNDFWLELTKEYPPQVNVMPCPSGCRCSYFDPIHLTPVKDKQVNRKFRVKNCEYDAIFAYDVKATIWWGICKKSEA